MNMYLQSSLSINTRRTYSSGFKAYQSFCAQLFVHMFPLKENTLQLYVTSLAGRLQFSTIKVYLSSLQYCSILRGYEEKIATMGKLYYVMRGIRRLHAGGKKQRLPITPSHLRQMILFIEQSGFTKYDKSMWKALILIAFYGLLRVPEYVCPSKHKFEKDINLMPSDLVFTKDIVTLNIKASKGSKRI